MKWVRSRLRCAARGRPTSHTQTTTPRRSPNQTGTGSRRDYAKHINTWVVGLLGRQATRLFPIIGIDAELLDRTRLFVAGADKREVNDVRYQHGFVRKSRAYRPGKPIVHIQTHSRKHDTASEALVPKTTPNRPLNNHRHSRSGIICPKLSRKTQETRQHPSYPDSIRPSNGYGNVLSDIGLQRLRAIWSTRRR